MEHALWEVIIGQTTLAVLVIYHPPLGNIGNTHTRCLDQVSELVQYSLTNHKNLVLLGDFNIAVQDLSNPDNITYRDTMEALGLHQHISIATHQLGNTLDHIYTESINTLGVLHSFQGDYISDHRLVGIEIDKKKHNNRLDLLPRRNYADLTTESFSKEFNNKTIMQHSILEDIWLEFQKEITRTLDKLVPKVKKRRGATLQCPWYNNSLLDQRQIVRR